MLNMDEIQLRLLREVAGLHDIPEGAYNIRANGKSAARQSSANITITPKENGSGLEIYIKPGTKNESVHIPVVMSESGLKEVVYNDFHIGDDCDILIVAGCGIDNCGQQDSQHDGIHRKRESEVRRKALRFRHGFRQADSQSRDGGVP